MLGLAALAACSEKLPAALAIPQNATAARCVNAVNGYAWRIRLDPQKKTVDGWPADFGQRQIGWRDGSDEAGYTLDRVTGGLTIMRASSTGGVANFDRCRAVPAGP